MKKSIIIDRQNRYNLILPQSPSMTDLPDQIENLFIDNEKVTFKVISWCMFPVIWAGDIIKIKPIKLEDASIGDIILYKLKGRAFAHRLVKYYQKEGKLYIVTSGEKEYRNNRFSNCSEIPADDVLGKVIEVKRGKSRFNPDEINLSLGSLIKGKLKLSLWNLIYGIKQCIAGILIKLQGLKLYRLFLRGLIKNKISFFVGTPIIKEMEEINNFCLYKKFSDFSKDPREIRGWYNLSARINNNPVGNISLFLEEIENFKVCALSNFIVRTPYRGGRIGYQLIERALYLCSRFNIDEIKVTLFQEDRIAYSLFKRLGFRVIDMA